MITTSYFSGKSPKARRVCIAKRAPFWHGPVAKLFVPSNPWAPDWQGSFLADLAQRFTTASALADYLRQIEAETPNAILCCFESNPEECHRRVLAAYIQEQLGEIVPEWVDPSPKQGNLLG